jgi:hypothetical protein
MALNAGKIKSKSNFERPEPLDPGTYPVRVVQILSMGLQKQRPYMGEPKDPAYELMVTYEFLDEFMKDKETGEELTDKPRWLSETFPMHSLDADLAKSTKRYLALDPTREHGGDWAELAGSLGMLQVVQNPSKKDDGVIYENITGLSAMRAKEASKAPELKNPPKVFDIDDPDMEVFGSLPQWIQDKMKENLEYGGSALEKAILASGEGSGKKQDSPPKEEPKASQEAPDEKVDEEEDW